MQSRPLDELLDRVTILRLALSELQTSEGDPTKEELGFLVIAATEIENDLNKLVSSSKS
jgi:hypothetical protein